VAVADGFQNLLKDKSRILLGEKLLLNYPLEKFTSHADPRGDLKTASTYSMTRYTFSGSSKYS
jgi:hypothetical protein